MQEERRIRERSHGHKAGDGWRILSSGVQGFDEEYACGGVVRGSISEVPACIPQALISRASGLLSASGMLRWMI